MEFRAMTPCDLSQILTQVETSPRRPRRRGFLSIGAAAAAVVVDIGAARSAPTDTASDDAALLDLMRREDEIRNAGCELQDQAFVLKREATAEQLADPAFCGKTQDLKARGDALVKQAGEVLEQIDS